MPSYLRHPLFKFITSIIATQNQTIQDDRSNRQTNNKTETNKRNKKASTKTKSRRKGF